MCPERQRHIYENSLVKDHSERIVREANCFLCLKGTTRGTPCSNSFDFSQWYLMFLVKFVNFGKMSGIVRVYDHT